jgi:vitamin B12/bleomycin/antimicrobial peptide transport system ATP-binding/permease protein
VRVVSRSFVADIWSLARPYWVSEERWVARGLLALLVALSLGSIYISVLVNHWNAAFYNALQQFDAAEFFRQLLIFLMLTIANVVCAVYQVYLNQMLQIRWRRWLTESFLAAWLKNQSYYRGALRGAASENPDQRISEDLGLFVVYTLSMSLGVLSSAVTLVSFIAILWSLSGSLVVPFGPLGAITIPGYMVWAALLYASLGTWLALRIGAPLVRINFDLQRYEADFRLSMARFQEHAESIALTRGEANERLRFRARFARVLRNSWAIMRRQKRLTWFTWTYGQLALVFPILVAAPRYFAREIMLGGLMQTAQAFTQVQGALSFILNSYPDIARWRAAVDRLVGFERALDDTGSVLDVNRGIEIVRSNTAALHVDGLDLDLPTGQPLLRGLSFTVRPGRSLLIAGPVGSGKTTVLRAIAGIWPYGNGRIEIPAGTREVIMPEKPYLPVGTLRQALIYPQVDSRLTIDGTDMYWDQSQIGSAEHAGLAESGHEPRHGTPQDDGLPTDTDLQRALALCGLAHLTSRLDEEQNWSQRLSLNEQKRLAFARLLLQRPDIIFLDETTAGLDEESETRLYRVLREELPNAMVITVGHRGTLRQLHEEHLDLRRSGAGTAEDGTET